MVIVALLLAVAGTIAVFCQKGDNRYPCTWTVSESM